MPVTDHLSLNELVLPNLDKFWDPRIVCPLPLANAVVVMITGVAFYSIQLEFYLGHLNHTHGDNLLEQ